MSGSASLMRSTVSAAGAAVEVSWARRSRRKVSGRNASDTSVIAAIATTYVATGQDALSYFWISSVQMIGAMAPEGSTPSW